MQYLTSEVVGDAIDTTSPMQTAFEQRLLQSNDTYVALLNLSRPGGLNRTEEMRVVRGLLQAMQAAGAGQPSNRLARLNDIERRLTALQNQFMDNLQASQEVRRAGCNHRHMQCTGSGTLLSGPGAMQQQQQQQYPLREAGISSTAGSAAVCST